MAKLRLESSAINRVRQKHIGTEVLVRLVNQGFPKQATIEALSPDGLYFRAGRNWLPNVKGSVLCVLAPKRRRRSAL